MEQALYVLLDKWADWEFAYAAAAVSELCGGTIENKTVSAVRAPLRSMGGLTCLPDHDLESAPKNCVALVLVGGLSWRGETAKRVLPLVKSCAERGAVIGAICDACGFLASTGLLNNVKHTGNGVSELTAFGGAYNNETGFVPKQAVRDGNVITANGTAPLEFARELCLALGADKKKTESWYTFCKRGYFSE